MKIINLNNEKNINIEKNYIGLGNFDGLHKGHMKIIKNLVETSKRDKVLSAILLFENHTLNTLLSTKQKQISSLEQKINILEKNKIDLIFIINFSKIKDLKPEEFILFLKEKLNVCGVFVGFNYNFGKAAKGNVETLKSFENKDFLLSVSQAELYKDKAISSTIIKDLITNNNFLEAETMLNRPYFLEGKVVPGKKLGSDLGFPTANIDLSTNYVLPSEGVYASQVLIDNKIYLAATSLGKNYTLDEKDLKVEAHILDFNENIYGKNIQIRFLKKLRPMEKFSSVEEMTEQVLKDIDFVRSHKFELE